MTRRLIETSHSIFCIAAQPIRSNLLISSPLQYVALISAAQVVVLLARPCVVLPTNANRGQDYVNRRSADGSTALMCCAQDGDAPDLVELLLAAQADPNASLETGETALFIAAQEGHVDCVAALAAGALSLARMCIYVCMTVPLGGRCFTARGWTLF